MRQISVCAILAITTAVFGQGVSSIKDPLPASVRAELDELWKAQKYVEYEQKVLSFMKASDNPLAQYGAAQKLLWKRIRYGNHISDNALTSAGQVLKDTRSTMPETLQYEVDHFGVMSLAARNLNKEAAEEATRVRKEWERVNDKVLNIHGLEPLRWYLAGDKKQAMAIIEDTKTTYPNDFLRNWVVRDEIAQSLDVHLDSTEAYSLLNDLQGSFPIEFAERPYLVQNYVEYASKAKLDDADRLRALKIATDAIAEHNWDKGMLASLYYSVAKNYHLLRDTERALMYYNLAKNSTADDDGEMSRNIRAWSDRSIKRLEAGDFDDLIELRYGMFKKEAKWFEDERNWAQVDRIMDIPPYGAATKKVEAMPTTQVASTDTKTTETMPANTEASIHANHYLYWGCAGLVAAAACGTMLIVRHRRRKMGSLPHSEGR